MSIRSYYSVLKKIIGDSYCMIATCLLRYPSKAFNNSALLQNSFTSGSGKKYVLVS